MGGPQRVRRLRRWGKASLGMALQAPFMIWVIFLAHLAYRKQHIFERLFWVQNRERINVRQM